MIIFAFYYSFILMCHLLHVFFAPIWFIRSIYYWNVNFLNEVIIKLKFSSLRWPLWFWLSCLGPLVFLLTVKLFSFPIFLLWAYLIKVIPETGVARNKLDIYIFSCQGRFGQHWRIKKGQICQQQNIRQFILWLEHCFWLPDFIQQLSREVVTIMKHEETQTPKYVF